MDWEYLPENPQGKRAFVRISEKNLVKMFDAQSVLVKVTTADTILIGSLRDICEGGLAVNLKVKLAGNQATKVEFFLGTEKIISRAIVRYIRPCDREYTIGMMFVDLNAASKKFISGMYASMVLRHAL